MMIKVIRAAAFAAGCLLSVGASAQTCPATNSTPALTAGGNVFGRISAQWNAYFGAKVDVNNGILCNPTIIPPPPGLGTVTGVTFTGDGTVLSSTPSAVVSGSGTLNATLNTQVPNVVLAGPASGGAAVPTFRTLATADLTGKIACSDLTNDGTACAANTGTSGAVLPFLSGGNTWSGAQTFGALTTLTPVPLGQSLVDTPGSIAWYGGYVGQRWNLIIGSDASPITTAGSALSIGYTGAVLNAACGGNVANTGCNSALLVHSTGLAATTMVTSGITIYATGAATAAGTDVQALNAVSNVTGSGIGIAMGAYLQGRRYTDTGGSLGAEISAGNYTASACALAYTSIGRCDGIWLVSRGLAGATRQLSAALHVGLGDANSVWREGITFNQNSVLETTIFDNSSSTSSILISGTHTTAIRTGLSAGFVGFGLASAPIARLQIGGAISAAQWGTLGIGLVYDNTTFTDTTSSGTVAANYVNRIGGPTLAASSATTYTEAVNLLIGSAPVAGTNVTITNGYSLQVQGNTRFNAGINMSGTTGKTQTCTVNTASALTLIFSNGVLTGGTCDL